MSEKTKLKKIIQNGAIKYTRVPFSIEDELHEKEQEILRLHSLIDQLRNRIDTLEQEQQRQQIIDKEAGPVSSYECYL
jgi:DNA repair exonuclease SbcCD ATPase subunit